MGVFYCPYSNSLAFYCTKKGGGSWSKSFEREKSKKENNDNILRYFLNRCLRYCIAESPEESYKKCSPNVTMEERKQFLRTGTVGININSMLDPFK